MPASSSSILWIIPWKVGLGLQAVIPTLQTTTDHIIPDFNPTPGSMKIANFKKETQATSRLLSSKLCFCKLKKTSISWTISGMVWKAKHVSGAGRVPGTSVGCPDSALECSDELVKKIITTGLAIRFWLNTTFVQYQSIKIKAFSWWLFITDIQTHLWLFYLWHCCPSPTTSWLKIRF